MTPMNDNLSVFEQLSLQEMRKINDNLEQLRANMVQLQVTTAEHALVLTATKTDLARVENICTTCQARAGYSSIKTVWQTLSVIGAVVVSLATIAWNIYKG